MEQHILRLLDRLVTCNLFGALGALGLDDGVALHEVLVGIYGAELGAPQFVPLGGGFFMEARQGVSGDYDTLVIMNTESVAATLNSV